MIFPIIAMCIASLYATLFWAYHKDTDRAKVWGSLCVLLLGITFTISIW